MKTRNLIFAILWALLAILMIVCAVAQFYAAEYIFAMIRQYATEKKCDILTEEIHG